MRYRDLGRTGWRISEISFGAWAIGGDVWGRTDDEESLRTLHRAFDLGVNFVDTADVYGDGHSERLIARALRDRSDEIVVAPKAGRRLDPHLASASLAQLALRWILMFPEITAAIPGAKNIQQVEDNVAAAGVPPLSAETMSHVQGVYDRHVRAAVHSRW